MEERFKCFSKFDKPRAVICDLDGTLSLFEKEDKTSKYYRNPYDASTCDKDCLNKAVAYVLERVDNVILLSGREEKYRRQTETFLDKHHIAREALYMRSTGDFRKDSIVKEELYRNHVQDNYHILFVIDDRDQVVKMWREIGLTCFQVAEGNF